MQFSTRNRHAFGLFAVRRMIAYLLVCCVAASCAAANESPQQAASQDHTARATPTSAPGSVGRSATPRSATPSRKPSRLEQTETTPDPPTRDAAAMAGQLNDAVATLRDQNASDADRGKAAEFQQLAIRSLVNSPEDFRQDVTGRLESEAALVTRAQIRASQELATISDPRDTLPDWRIVAPASPDQLLRHYREAHRRTGVPWTYLAAIHLVETRMGRIRGTSSAGARGPMQFSSSTWKVYGHGGDINDDRDAILAAARLLRANGAPDDMSAALWHYNPAAGYVQAVKEYARTIRESKSAYVGYWHWQVIYSCKRGTFILPVGYPEDPAIRLPRSKH